MHRLKCSLVMIAFVSTFVLAWWGEAGAMPFSFQINRFQVNQGGDLVNDGFDDGLEPPSGPTPSGPTDPNLYTTTGTFGTGDESGSSLVLNEIGAFRTTTFVGGIPIDIIGARRRLLIPQSGGDFFVEADFAGILPADTFAALGTREQYRIRLRDFDFPTSLGSGNNNDAPGVRVVNVGGAPRIQFFDTDPSAGTFNVLGFLSPGSLSSELTLRLDVNASGIVTGSFDPDGPSGPAMFSSIPGMTSIYDGETFTFAQFQALSPVPEPGTLLLLGSGLVGMGAVARRRKRGK